MGLHFLAFWPCGPSFPFILAFSGSASGPPPQVAKNGPFAQRPYNGFISAVTGSILQFLAFWAFISLHFGLVGLHFLAFWPCGPSFPFILAFSGSASGSPPQVAKNCPFAQRPYNGFISAVTGPILQFLAFWAFISLHFGLVGLHLAFGSTLVKATLVSIYMCMQVCVMSVQFQRFTCIQNCANKNWRPISPDPGQRKPTPLRNPRSTPKQVKKLKQVFSIIIARACSTLVKAILLRMYARMCM